MDALKAAGLCALLASPLQAAQPCGSVVEVSSPVIDRWQALIEAASQRFRIPVKWIRAVMARESAGFITLHGAPIVSSAGAMGLMQLMPETWLDMRMRYSLGNDPFDPRDSIFAGTAYLREMFDRYGYPDLFAAYHAGPRRLDAALTGLKMLPETTKTYFESIVPDAEITPLVSEKRTSTTLKTDSNSLFFVRRDGGDLPAPTANPVSTAHALFVPHATPSDSGAR
jgi:hypothetical protein